MGLLKDLIIKLGLDSSGVDKGVNQAGGSLDKLKGMVGKVGAAMGIAFGVSELINFGKEIIGLASKTEGVKRAFDRLGMPSLMNDLKQATRGAVSEFDLMKSAVSANNFKIPLENLSSYLAFATRRAEETGQSVDYLVDSIIMGIGRKSPMILDNLGISILDIRNEMEKTGDMAKAVANIINSEMANAGETMDTAATKTARLTAEWENLKTTLGGLMTGTSGEGASRLSKWLENTNKILKNDTIPLYLRFFAIFDTNSRNQIVRMQTINELNRAKVDAEVKSLLNTEKQAEAVQKVEDADDKRLKTLNLLIAKQNDFINLEGNYTVENVKKLRLLENEKQAITGAKNAALEKARVQAELEEKALEEAKKAAEAEAKKRLEIEQTRKAASEAIKQNKGSINDYETLIKLNDDLLKMAKSDDERLKISRENSALKTKLELINKIIERQVSGVGVSLLEAPKTKGVTKLGREKVDISDLDTSDLKGIVDEYEAQANRVGEISNEMAATMQGSVVSAFQALGTAIGTMGEMNAGQAIASLLNPIADMAISAGTMIMMTGTAIEALKASLVSFFGGSAIVAGAALVAVGVAAKAGLAALASSGGKSQRQASVSGGSFLGAKDYESRSEMVTVQVEGKLKGSDIYISNQKEATRRKNGF